MHANSALRDEMAFCLGAIQNNIARACKSAGRNVDEITLIAVSKGQSYEKIAAAYELGLRDFGENYVVELHEKQAWALSAGLNEIRWHFLGAIQSNKIKLLKDIYCLHSLASLRHAKLLNEQINKKLPVFLQVNLNDEPGRQGFTPGELLPAFTEIMSLPQLQVQGLMAVLPIASKHAPEHWLKNLLNLKQKIMATKLLSHPRLSVGMSDDYEVAIRHGSDVVRIGSALLGTRS
jgi:pyridoxal phosphate enzyme (YggS family)